MATRNTSGSITVIDRLADFIDQIVIGRINVESYNQTYDLRAKITTDPHLWPHHEECIIEIMTKLNLKHEKFMKYLRECEDLRKKYDAKLEEMTDEEKQKHRDTQEQVRMFALDRLIVLRYAGHLDQLTQDNAVLGVEDQLPEDDEVLQEEAPNELQQNDKNLSAEVQNHLQEIILAEVLNQPPKINKDHLEKFLNLLRETLLARAILYTKKNKEAQDAKALNQIQEIILDKVLNNLQENQKNLLKEALNQNRENCKVDEFVNELQRDLRVEDENKPKNYYEGVLAKVVNERQETLLGEFLHQLQKSLHAEAENKTDGNNEAPNLPQEYYKVLIKEFANDLQGALSAEAENQPKEQTEALFAKFVSKIQDNLLTKILNLLRETSLAEAMDRKFNLKDLQKNYQQLLAEARKYNKVLVDEFVNELKEDLRKKARYQPEENTEACMSLFCELHTPKEKYLQNLNIFKLPSLKIKEEVTFEALLEQSFKLRYDNYELIMILMDIIFKIIKFRFPSENALFS